jgi:hypothetical protein
VVLVKNFLAAFTRPELQGAQSIITQPFECFCTAYSKTVDILDKDVIGCCRVSSNPGVCFRRNLEAESIIDETLNLIWFSQVHF